MTLQEMRRWQNRHYGFIDYEDEVSQPFAYFISEHPNLYAGVDLNSYEIDFINNHFWSYEVDPRTFEQEYIQALRESVGIYNNMKQIELTEDVFNINDDSTVRHLLSTNENESTQEGEKDTDNTTTRKNDNKSANKELPMESDGSSFNSIIDWSNGGSNIAEDTSEGEDKFKGKDKTKVENSGTNSGEVWETVDHKGLPVESIEKIWNWLYKAKSTNYLISQLSKCFILVY